MYVSLDRQNPHLAFKTLQYHNMWASYDMLEKTIIRNFAEKASLELKNEGLLQRCLRYFLIAVVAASSIRKVICPSVVMFCDG